MKTITLFMICTFYIAASISANETFKLDRLIFERVSYDNGETWEPALCKHVKLGKRGINCEASIPESTRMNKNGDKEIYRFEAHSHHRFNSSFLTESGDTINDIIEFSGNVIKHNGRILALMEEGITSVSFYTPDMKAFIVLHAGEMEGDLALDAINDIAVRNSEFKSPAIEIKAFPNPLTGNTLNLQSNIQVYKTIIYDTSGRPLITDNEVWNNRRSFSLEGFPPGNYLIECHTGRNGNSPTTMIKILKQ